MKLSNIYHLRSGTNLINNTEYDLVILKVIAKWFTINRDLTMKLLES